jgi:glucosamine--fructose-6-phosphate aminotransferase (isomerizing)
MCGIVGYIGEQEAAPIVLHGLRQLEYRGYDSAGLAVIDADGAIQVRREAGKLLNLEETVAQAPVCGCVGVGHTRWATHGPPSQRNAHPHSSPDGDLVVVQNGIVENFLANCASNWRRRATLPQRHRHRGDRPPDHQPLSQRQRRRPGGRGARRAARVARAERHRRAVGMSPGPADCGAAGQRRRRHHRLRRGRRCSSPATSRPFCATRAKSPFWTAGRWWSSRAAGARFTDLDGRAGAQEAVHTIDWNPSAAEKGEYRHFMQKEIFEQGRSLTDTLRSRLDFRAAAVTLDSLNLRRRRCSSCARSRLWRAAPATTPGWWASTTSSGWRGCRWRWITPASSATASPMVTPDTLVLAITQSGETVDTLAALEEARSARRVHRGHRQRHRQPGDARVTDGHIYMQAGPEIGVASTKAFTASATDLYLLAIYLGQARGAAPAERSRASSAPCPRCRGWPASCWKMRLAQRPLSRAGRALSHLSQLPLPGPRHQLPHRAGRRAQAQGDQLHPRRGLPRGRDEARPDCADRRHDADRRRRPARQRLRQDAQPGGAGQGAQRAGAGRGPRRRCRDARQGRLTCMPIPRRDELLTPILAVMPLQIFAYEMRGDQPRGEERDVESQPRNSGELK